MAHINLRRSTRPSKLGFSVLVLAAIMWTTITSLIPLYVSQSDFNIGNTKDIAAVVTLQNAKKSLTSLSVSYILPAGLTRKRATQSVTNRQTTASCLTQALGAAKGSINVTGIGSAAATTTKGRRRRRDIQCDKTDRPGVAIIFDVALGYPEDLPCQTLACQVDLFTGIHGQFNTVTDVSITADDGTPLPVQLCHVESHADGTNNNPQSSSGIAIEPCTIVCQNGGACTGPTTCGCTTAWTGDTCETPVCTSGCQNGGTCTAPDTCACAAGWSDATCETAVCTSGCQHGGTCTAPDTCTCAAGWSGATCTLGQ
ncbi:unnamed protein product [Adineta steineri]|uniref:EGF-like domain-containing protein n=2 Tax=Adineta steineri TaxID=433720 RepID=A0A814M2P1_9BILA|nr:unnamed protein product [Adineta steineri]